MKLSDEDKKVRNIDMHGLSVKLHSKKDLDKWRKLSLKPNAERGKALVTRHNYDAKQKALKSKQN